MRCCGSATPRHCDRCASRPVDAVRRGAGPASTKAPRALSDRLLALPPELRRLGVPQISQVAMLDVGQVARLSPLFD
jgi:hypothetical protein